MAGIGGPSGRRTQTGAPGTRAPGLSRPTVANGGGAGFSRKVLSHLVTRLLVITNSGAGTSDRAILDVGLEILREKAEVEVAETGDPDQLDQVLGRADGRRIVVAGGDGSVHAVVAALRRRGTLADSELALLPMGTGNDFARGNDIPLDIEESARLVLDGQPRRVDLLVDDTGEVVVNHVHAGAGAQASRRGSRWKRRLGSIGFGRLNLGKLGYPIGALLAAVRPPHLHLRIEIDGQVVNDTDQPVLMVAVGNAATVGGGTQLTPEADPEDGRVDVMISRSVGPWQKFAYVAHLGRRRHHERDDVRYLRASRVSISGQQFWCSADGEVHGPVRSRSWQLERAAYAMVLPR